MYAFLKIPAARRRLLAFQQVDYTTHKPGTLYLTPPPEHLSDWKADYTDMLGPMFFG